MIQSKSKAIFLLAVVFLLGIIIGASLGATYLSKRFSSQTERRPPRKEHLVERFKSRLSLTPQQVEQLKNIFEESEQRYRDLYQPLAAQHEALMKDMQSKISQMLTDEQKPEYNKMVQEFEKGQRRFGDRSRHLPGTGPRPGPPGTGPGPAPDAESK